MTLRLPSVALLVLVLLVAGRPALSQAPPADSLALISLNETTYTSLSATSGGTSVSYSFRVGDGPEQSAGFTGAGLRPALASNPEALAELGRFRSKRVRSTIGASVLVGGVVTALIIGINDPTGERVFDPRTGQTVDKTTPNAVAFVPIGIGIVGLFYAGANYTGASRHIERAVTIYNDGVVGRGGAAAARPVTVGLAGSGLRLTVPL